MRVRIEAELCTGHGRCYSLAPDVFGSDDDGRGFVISDDLWRRRFSADPRGIGKAVRINNLTMQIAGVLSPGFRLFLPPSVSGSEQIDIWFPWRLSTTRKFRGIPVAARLRPIGARYGRAICD